MLVDNWNLNIKGSVRVEHYESGKLVNVYNFDNLIVDNVTEVFPGIIDDAFNGTNVYTIDNFKVGTDDTAPTTSDTDVLAVVASGDFPKALTSTTKSGPNTVEFRLDVEETEGNTVPDPEYKEVGLFSNGGVMTSRVILNPPIIKTTTTRITVFWTYQFN